MIWLYIGMWHSRDTTHRNEDCEVRSEVCQTAKLAFNLTPNSATATSKGLSVTWFHPWTNMSLVELQRRYQLNSRTINVGWMCANILLIFFSFLYFAELGVGQFDPYFLAELEYFGDFRLSVKKFNWLSYWSVLYI